MIKPNITMQTKLQFNIGLLYLSGRINGLKFFLFDECLQINLHFAKSYTIHYKILDYLASFIALLKIII